MLVLPAGTVALAVTQAVGCGAPPGTAAVCSRAEELLIALGRLAALCTWSEGRRQAGDEVQLGADGGSLA